MMKRSMLLAAMLGFVGCVDSPSEDPQTNEVSSDSTLCWSVAGLYNSPCGSIREDMHSGETIDIRGLQQFDGCDFAYWTPVTHHATGHQGWVRTDALCGF